MMRVMKRRPQLGFCLATSHVDIRAAKLWLRWAVFLSQQKGGDVSDLRLLVSLTHRVSDVDMEEIRGIVANQPTFFITLVSRITDEDERGYPGSSSHLFCRSLQAFNELYTGFAMMFCEADTAPLRPTWAHELADDYARRSAPFVGLHIPSTEYAVGYFGMPSLHVTGNAMYPPNALKLAPSIEGCLSARLDNCPWGEKGWAWDLFCAHEIVPESEQTDAIQQIWRSDPWTPDNLNRLSPKAALFHQSKDGSLVASLAMRHYPEVLDQLPQPDRCYQLDTGATSITVGGRTIQFKVSRQKGCGGRPIAILAPTLAIDDALLSGVAGRAGLTVISRDDYEKLAR
jgi:hypothetical protein